MALAKYNAMITMTWPQYLRHECRVTARLSPQESELLSTLLVRHPRPVTTAELIEAIWPDPDHEAEFAQSRVWALVCSIGRKIGAGRIEHDGIGYRLNQQGQ